MFLRRRPRPGPLAGSEWPSPRTPLAELPLLAVDMETTGLRPARHSIVSIAWVPVNGRSIDLSRAGYHVVSGTPGVSVGSSAIIHQLTDEDLAAGIPESEAIEQLLHALRGRVLLAHFAPVEEGFLRAACRRHYRQTVRLPIVDTFVLERRHMERMGTYPRGEDLRLPRARERYSLPRYPGHHALHDALGCAELYLAQTVRRAATGETVGDLPHSGT